MSVHRIICAHPYRPVAVGQAKTFPGIWQVWPGNVWLDRKVGVLRGQGGFAEAASKKWICSRVW